MSVKALASWKEVVQHNIRDTRLVRRGATHLLKRGLSTALAKWYSLLRHQNSRETSATSGRVVELEYEVAELQTEVEKLQSQLLEYRSLHEQDLDQGEKLEELEAIERHRRQDL